MTREKIILKNYLFYFLTFIVICFVGITNVFGAYTYTDVGYFSSQTQVQVSVNYASQPLSLTQGNNYQLEQVYSLDMNVSNINLTTDFVYMFEIYLPGTILTNANMAQVINTSGSNPVNCTIIDTYFTNEYPHVTFKCDGSANITSLYIKYYNSNNQYLFSPKLVNWNYTYMRKRIPDSSDNTGEIKDAINSSTETIINNQNSNTQQIIDSTKVCNDIEYVNSPLGNSGATLSSDGSVSSSANTNDKVSDYISIQSGSTYSLSTNFSSNNLYCLYNSSKIKISCSSTPLNSSVNISPNEDGYIRFFYSTYNGWKTTFRGRTCKNGNQSLDDTLTDDDVDDATSSAESFFSDFSTNTFGLTSIITAPLNLINSLTSSSCVQLHLPLPYLSNKYLDLPCMSTIYSTYFGSFFTLYQTVTYGIIAYWVVVRIFNQVKDFKNPEHDEIEVVDL